MSEMVRMFYWLQFSMVCSPSHILRALIFILRSNNRRNELTTFEIQYRYQYYIFVLIFTPLSSPHPRFSVFILRSKSLQKWAYSKMSLATFQYPEIYIQIIVFLFSSFCVHFPTHVSFQFSYESQRSGKNEFSNIPNSKNYIHTSYFVFRQAHSPTPSSVSLSFDITLVTERNYFKNFSKSKNYIRIALILN